MGHDVYKVASPEGWIKKSELILDFYNLRRKEDLLALPIDAHKDIALIENF